MTLTPTFAILLCLWFPQSARAQESKPIEKEEIAKWINRLNECPDDPPLYFYRLDYFDFKGDGTKQAIVVASTCMTGTAGPDIHSVFSRNSDGELIELKVPDADRKTYDNLFGNRNYDLSVEDGLLVATFGDDSDRDTPLAIKYKWNGKEFAIASIQKTGVFPTSYDCTKATGEVERAICHVSTLANLDVQLNALYKTLQSKLNLPDREVLRQEQRQWVVTRDKQCAPYKGWVSCLTDYYQKRIDELKKRTAAIAPKDLSHSRSS
jgi:uncharacterized protein YecT (DUF1311 family)